MPFFSSLTHTGTRVGGLREHGTQRFEAGTPHFPQDYIGTRAYQDHWDKRAQEEKAKWERTPKAKRVPFDKLPEAGKRERVVWQPDWSGILGIHEDPSKGTSSQFVASLIPTQPNDEFDDLLESLIHDEQRLASEPDAPAPPAVDTQTMGEEGATLSTGRLWTLHGPSAVTLLQTMACSMAALASEGFVLTHINGLRNKRGLDPYPASMASSLLKSALVMVRVRMCGRGVPDDMAVIYAADRGDLKESVWRASMQRDIKGSGEASHGEEAQVSAIANGYRASL